MKTIKNKNCFLLCFLLVLGALANTSATAVTPEQIKESIEAGVNWLVAQQNSDGSWGQYYYSVASTGFAVIKLEEYAFEMGFDSPFNPAYEHAEAIEAGLAYIFRNAQTIPISSQAAGDPDSDGDGVGVYFGTELTYDTGICMMAIAASRAPGRVVNVPGSPVNGWTYKQVLDDVVDYMAFGQIDFGDSRGGWNYDHTDNAASRSDNSNGGYAVLGLAYAEDATCGFNCVIPQFLKNELSLYIDYIQTDGGPDDGGSGYDGPGYYVNILKTGNLIFEMTFVGFPVGEPRLQRSLAYLGRWWNDPSQNPGWKGPPPHYQAMYCTMKGLTYAGIETIDIGGTPVDWYSQFAEAIVSNQQSDGRWPSDYWGDAVLATEWALLTLEKIAPPVPEPFGQWVYQSKSFEPMNLNDYVSGAPPFHWTHEPTEHVILTIGPGNVLTIDYDHTWYGEEIVKFTVTDKTGQSADVYATFTVIGVPKVGDIPDQTTPFEPFDLDNYLLQMKPGDVKWTASLPPAGWTVEVDPDNVVTVTAPADATGSATIEFTATNAICPAWWLALGNAPPSSVPEKVTFMLKKPMKSFLIEKAEITWASNTFVISGNFELPKGYQKTDLDRSAVLSIQIASTEAKDTVAFMDLGQAWAFMNSGFDGSLSQGMKIQKFDISWSNSPASFYTKGGLSLAGIGLDTQPREAIVTLELGGKPPVVGKAMVGFERQGNVWYYGANPTSVKPVADGAAGGQLGSDAEPSADSAGDGNVSETTDNWDAGLDELFYFEYLAPSAEAWLDEPLYFEDGGMQDFWLGEQPDSQGTSYSDDIWLDVLLNEDPAMLDDPWLDNLFRLWP